MAGLTVASLVESGLQLHWVAAGQAKQVGFILIAVPFVLQLIACVFAFLARDGAAGAVLGVLGTSWGAIGVVHVASKPGARSGALGLLLLISAAVIILSGAAVLQAKPLPALVFTIAALRPRRNPRARRGERLAGRWRHRRPDGVRARRILRAGVRARGPAPQTGAADAAARSRSFGGQRRRRSAARRRGSRGRRAPDELAASRPRLATAPVPSRPAGRPSRGARARARARGSTRRSRRGRTPRPSAVRSASASAARPAQARTPPAARTRRASARSSVPRSRRGRRACARAAWRPSRRACRLGSRPGRRYATASGT